MSMSSESAEAFAEIERRFYELDDAIYKLARVQGLKGNPNGVYWILKEATKLHQVLRKLDRLCDNICE